MIAAEAHMDFSINELRVFCEVANTGNMSTAARTIGVTQPALSWSVKKMEKNLGVELFHRTKKGVVLTRAGETLLARSRELMRNWENLREAMLEDENAIRGIYNLGVHGTIATYTLPQFYPSMYADHPHIDLRLTHDLSRNIADMVVQYKLDFGIVVDPPPHADLVITPLYKDIFTFWIREDELTDDIMEKLIICNPRLLRTETLMREAMRSGQILGEQVLHTTELELIANLVSNGTGVAVLPATVAMGRPGTKLVQIPGAPCVEDNICLIYRQEAVVSQAGRTIKNSILESLRDNHPLGIKLRRP